MRGADHHQPIKYSWYQWPSENGDDEELHVGPESASQIQRTLCGAPLPFWAAKPERRDADPEPCEECRRKKEEKGL